jgi:hypothetical protein
VENETRRSNTLTERYHYKMLFLWMSIEPYCRVPTQGAQQQPSTRYNAQRFSRQPRSFLSCSHQHELYQHGHNNSQRSISFLCKKVTTIAEQRSEFTPTWGV